MLTCLFTSTMLILTDAQGTMVLPASETVLLQAGGGGATSEIQVGPLLGMTVQYSPDDVRKAISDCKPLGGGE